MGILSQEYTITKKVLTMGVIIQQKYKFVYALEKKIHVNIRIRQLYISAIDL